MGSFRQPTHRRDAHRKFFWWSLLKIELKFWWKGRPVSSWALKGLGQLGLIRKFLHFELNEIRHEKPIPQHTVQILEKLKKYLGFSNIFDFFLNILEIYLAASDQLIFLYRIINSKLCSSVNAYMWLVFSCF